MISNRYYFVKSFMASSKMMLTEAELQDEYDAYCYASNVHEESKDMAKLILTGKSVKSAHNEVNPFEPVSIARILFA